LINLLGVYHYDAHSATAERANLLDHQYVVAEEGGAHEG